jgi:uncharacterized cofD-like protein
MATTPIELTARVRGADAAYPDAVSTVRGQVEVATSPGQLLEVSLDPVDPPACPEAVTAVREADWVVLGPGSWFTSVIPHLLVPGLRSALMETSARLVVTLNLEAHTEETPGYTPGDHLAVLRSIAPGLPVDTVVADVASVPDAAALEKVTDALGARLVLADVADDARPGQHDPAKLSLAYEKFVQAN